eukprot:gene25677-31011_t
MGVLGSLAIILLVFIVVSSGDDSSEEKVAKMPKIELHAHLHGSVRRSTMLELAAEKNITTPLKLSLDQYDHGVVDKPFELFPIVHSIVDRKEVVGRILLEMIQDYKELNTIYLEVRTTPRSLPDGTTIEGYLQLVTRIIAEYNTANPDGMLVKLVISIDRSKKYADAIDLLQLIKEYTYIGEEKVIVGIDFSGNPLGGRFQDFASLFTEARHMGLNVTVHTAELKQLSERREEDMDETSFILSYWPDRIGHMLHPMERHFDQMVEMLHSGGKKPPLIEICPSTAYYLLGLHSYADHPHLRKFMSLHYPVSINTDDSGIFSTTLTQEILHVVLGMDVSLADILRMQVTAVEYAFVSSSERSTLRKTLRLLASELFAEEVIEEVFGSEEGEPKEIDMSHLYTM